MQDVQQTTLPRRRGDPSVPFGVRALESGIEVDGVWHSRSNTPAPSIPDSPMSSASASPRSIRRPSSPDRTSTSSNISKLEMPQPVHGYPGVGHVRAVSASGVVNAPFERGIAPERSSSRPNSISPEYLNRDITRGHQTYQPRRSSHLRFSNSQSDSSAAMAALEGHHLIAKRESSDGKLRYFFSAQNSDSCWFLRNRVLWTTEEPKLNASERISIHWRSLKLYFLLFNNRGLLPRPPWKRGSVNWKNTFMKS